MNLDFTRFDGYTWQRVFCINFDFSARAAKKMRQLNEPDFSRLLNAIYALPSGDIKPLIGFIGLYRLRVGNWRVVFSYLEKDVIFIEKIEPRGQAYKS